MAPKRVAGDLYADIDGQMLEIKRQLRQRDGYPYDPMRLVDHLQAAIEGNLVNRHGKLFMGTTNEILLLEKIGTTEIPAQGRFVVQERFAVDVADTARVKISYLGDNFRKWFIGKIEEPTALATLRYAKLTRFSVDGPILVELGDKAETTLSQVCTLMERQPNGEEGVLLADGQANIFYVRDADGVLRAVSVHWGGDGWRVYALLVGYPGRWRGDDRVFSRNS